MAKSAPGVSDRKNPGTANKRTWPMQILLHFRIFAETQNSIMENPIKPQETKKPKRKTQYREGDMILRFKLKRIVAEQTPLMKEWLSAEAPVFDVFEQQMFDKKLKEALNNSFGWSEEDMKMKFIAFILDLGHLLGGDGFVALFDKKVSASVEGTKLTAKSDFMIAKGIMNVYTTPYFHFQQYKPNEKPERDSMGQLLEAFLIAQETNKDGNPIYGIEIVRQQWMFIIMEGKEYCISRSLFSTKKEDLLQIIAMLRKFRHILETRLIGNDESF